MRFDGLYRTDPERTRFTGALCGLGWDHNSGGAALPENDIEVAFDTAFDAEDISSVSILWSSVVLVPVYSLPTISKHKTLTLKPLSATIVALNLFFVVHKITDIQNEMAL